MDIRIKLNLCKRKVPKVHRIKWWNLNNEDKKNKFTKAVFDNINWNMEEEADKTWEKVAKEIRNIAQKVLGVSKGNKCNKESWWWDEGIQEKVKEKKACYKSLYTCRSDENLEKYKNAKKEVKKVVSEAKKKAFENFYKKLDTKEGEKDIYKIAKVRERNTRDLTEIKCIKMKMGVS